MNILILGSGGRECAFAQKIAKSSLCLELYIAPGNAGTAKFGTNVDLDPMDFAAVKGFCLTHQIDLLLPGSETPLVAGIYDSFHEDKATNHIQVLGPSAAGAQLEGSKSFAKGFMVRHEIPTASYQEFDQSQEAEGLAYLEQHSLPIVLKADGLAAGKGVIITEDREEAKETFKAMLSGQAFGKAGSRVVIEGFLKGIECSVFVLTDGENYAILPEAKDYKRIGENETGLNTGGMGAVSPVPFVDESFMKKIETKIIAPTIKGIKEEQLAYQGFIFFGLIKVGDEPFVIEYNCRMGDPETEVVLPRLRNDLLDLFKKMKEGQLNQVGIKHDPNFATTVMLVSGGYPEQYKKGKLIYGLEKVEDALVFHAGTINNEGGEIQTNGGRVLAVTGMGPTLEEALTQAYENADKIEFEDKYMRRDIGFEFLTNSVN